METTQSLPHVIVHVQQPIPRPLIIEDANTSAPMPKLAGVVYRGRQWVRENPVTCDCYGICGIMAMYVLGLSLWLTDCGKDLNNLKCGTRGYVGAGITLTALVINVFAAFYGVCSSCYKGSRR